MSEKKCDARDAIDYSSVTPATGTDPDNKPIANNEFPTADMPAGDKSPRSDPDKIIPGPEAATGVDGAEEDQTIKDRNARA